MLSIYEYVALGIDFEGCICVARRKNQDGVNVYQATVRVINTSHKMLVHFKHKVRIGYVDDGYQPKTGSRIYNWYMRPHEIRQYLPLIEPHLVLKIEQAQLTIEISSMLKTQQGVSQGHKSRRKYEEIYTQAQRDRFEEIYQRMTILNSKNKIEELTESEKLLRHLRGR